MKKSILLIALALFAISVTQAQRVSVTATKKNNNTALAGSYTLSADGVQYITNATAPFIGYVDPFNSKNVISYTVSDHIDTLYKRLNLQGANVVKVLVSSIVSGTSRDTAISWLVPIKNLNERKAQTVTSQPNVTQQAMLTTASGYKKLYLVETVSILNARIDSIFEVANNTGTYAYDTSNYTQKIADKHIVLNSTTADTLTLLNPSQFSGRDPIVVANIGSAAYTIAGGFTVKDKSGSNVTSLTANTVYTFKSYYNGSAYIWLKEY